MRKKNQVVLVKLETTYDTDSVPTVGSNSILAYDLKFKEDVKPVRRLAQVASLSRLPSVQGARFAQLDFKVEIKGSGTPGTAPRIGAILRASSFAQTSVSNTSVTYLPTSALQESVTVYFLIDGRQHIMTGCVGDVKMRFPAGEFPYLEVTLMGRYAAPTLVALTTPTLESTTPPVCKSVSFSYNSRTTLVLKEILIEMNNVVATRVSISDPNAIAGFLVTGRDPIVTIDPEAIIETSYDFRGDAMTNQRALSWAVGSASGNILTLSIPKYNPYFPEYEDRDEILVEKIKGEATQNSGNDEVSLIFT